ncbi:tail fiber assembly protein [Klebsiella variicola]|uniref:tail fiber assembly protein n=1 Tax=Klebsiella variicola TaxID=244366 RepID=UPI001FA7DFC3|nr:tail fiber assembly protein [Klebsiella variicola]MCI4412489.1 hypothetical protein [Klebsiella variicola]
MQFSVLAQAFYDPDYSYKNKPDDITDISAELYESLKQATAGGCVVYNSGGGLVSSEPRPTPYHEWDDASYTWAISDTAKQQQKDDAIAAADAKKSALLADANAAIAPLQDAFELDMATDAEKAQLLACKKYRVLLMRVDTAKPVWPTP